MKAFHVPHPYEQKIIFSKKKDGSPPNSARHQRHNLFCQKIGVARRVPRINNGGSLVGCTPIKAYMGLVTLDQTDVDAIFSPKRQYFQLFVYNFLYISFGASIATLMRSVSLPNF